MKKKVVLLLVLTMIFSILPINSFGNTDSGSIRIATAGRHDRLATYQHAVLELHAADLRNATTSTSALFLRVIGGHAGTQNSAQHETAPLAFNAGTAYFSRLNSAGDNGRTAATASMNRYDVLDWALGSSPNQALVDFHAAHEVVVMTLSGGSVTHPYNYREMVIMIQPISGVHSIVPPTIDGTILISIPMIINAENTRLNATFYRDGVASLFVSDSSLNRTAVQGIEISVGAASARLQSGVPSQITFPVITNNIPDGYHPFSFRLTGSDNFLSPVGFTQDSNGWFNGTISITNNRGTLVVNYNGTSAVTVNNNRVDFTFGRLLPSGAWIGDSSYVIVSQIPIVPPPPDGGNDGYTENNIADDKNLINQNVDVTVLPQSPAAIMRLVIGSTTFTRFGLPMQSDVAPFIDLAAERTMVPIRIIAETLNAPIRFCDETRTVYITHNSTEIAIPIDVPLPDGLGTPVLVNGRTLVPVRYVSEILGATVRWDESAQAVYIYR